MQVSISKQEIFRAEYKRINPNWRSSLEIYLSLIQERLKPGSIILDAGSGRNSLLQHISLPDNVKVLGLDFDRQALLDNKFVNYKIHGKLEALPLQTSSCDLIVSSWVLEHVKQPYLIWSEIGRVLKQKGYFIFITPNKLNFVVWATRLLPWFIKNRLIAKTDERSKEDIYSTYFRANSIRQINGIAKACGFQKELLCLNGDPTYVAFSKFTFKIGQVLEKILDLKWFNRFKVHLIGVYRKL